MGRKDVESDNQPWKGRDQAPISPGFVFLRIFGAAAATAATGRWRRPLHWFYTQLWKAGYYFRFGNGVSGSGRNEQAWVRYRRRIREMEEDERERIERIRRMQEVFNRERNKRRKGHQAWTDHSTGSGWHQQFERDNWYYKEESHNGNQGTNYKASEKTVNYAKSHHYTILGLDRYRTQPYSDDEIKIAFRKKALEVHPDRNQNNPATSEAKFKEVVASGSNRSSSSVEELPASSLVSVSAAI